MSGYMRGIVKVDTVSWHPPTRNFVGRVPLYPVRKSVFTYIAEAMECKSADAASDASLPVGTTQQRIEGNGGDS